MVKGVWPVDDEGLDDGVGFEGWLKDVYELDAAGEAEGQEEMVEVAVTVTTVD